MINSEDIKESVIIELLNIAPNVSIYKEAKTTPKYPHFYVNQLTVSTEEQRKNYFLYTYSMMIRYRVASDPSTDLRLQQNLDNMAFNLLQNFNIIDFNDSKVRCYDKSVEKIDGVLFFSFKIDLLCYNKSNDKYQIMDKLEVNHGVRK